MLTFKNDIYNLQTNLCQELLLIFLNKKYGINKWRRKLTETIDDVVNEKNKSNYGSAISARIKNESNYCITDFDFTSVKSLLVFSDKKMGIGIRDNEKSIINQITSDRDEYCHLNAHEKNEYLYALNLISIHHILRLLDYIEKNRIAGNGDCEDFKKMCSNYEIKCKELIDRINNKYNSIVEIEAFNNEAINKLNKARNDKEIFNIYNDYFMLYGRDLKKQHFSYFLEVCSEREYEPAIKALAIAYYLGEYGLTRDVDKAETYVKKLKNEVFADNRLLLASIYEDKGKSEDSKKIIKKIEEELIEKNKDNKHEFYIEKSNMRGVPFYQIKDKRK